ILNVCKTYLESPLRCASGVTGAELKKRVRAILTGQVTELTLVRKAVLAIVGLWVLGIPIVVGVINVSPTRAQSQDIQAAFEVASVKPGNPALAAGPRIPNGDGTAAFPACAGGLMQVDPQRFSATSTTLYTLITLAYGIRYSCFIVSDASLL